MAHTYHRDSENRPLCHHGRPIACGECVAEDEAQEAAPAALGAEPHPFGIMSSRSAIERLLTPGPLHEAEVAARSTRLLALVTHAADGTGHQDAMSELALSAYKQGVDDATSDAGTIVARFLQPVITAVEALPVKRDGIGADVISRADVLRALRL